MLLSIGFFALMMFLFHRFASWWLFGIASVMVLGGGLMGAFQAGDGLGGAFPYWLAYAAIWLLFGGLATRSGADAAAKRRAAEIQPSTPPPSRT
jgi:hypothetical protein